MKNKVKQWWSSLKRSTGLRRTAFKSRTSKNSKPKKPLANKTRKRAKADRAVKSERDAFVELFPRCWNCGGWPTCCDEIVSGMSQRSVGVQHRLAWTSLCPRCNCFELNGSSPRVLIRKLALKWVYDVEFFDLPMTNVMRGKDPGAIEFDELVPEICRILDLEGRRAA